MTCACCDKKKRESRLRERNRRRREFEGPRRHLRQADRFSVPGVRIDLRFWKTTEQILTERLEHQYYYPFSVVSPLGQYQLRFTDDSYWYGVAALVMFIVTFVLFMLWQQEIFNTEQLSIHVAPSVILWDGDQFTLLPLIAVFFFLACWWMLTRYSVHILHVDCQTLTYELYKAGRLYYRGHFHNIYVKLKYLATVKDKRRRDADQKGMFYLTIGGYRIPPIFISSNSKNYREMRRLGRRIAANFNLNYVDKDAVSKHHVIRHRCPYSPLLEEDAGIDFYTMLDEVDASFDETQRGTERKTGLWATSTRSDARLKRTTTGTAY